MKMTQIKTKEEARSKAIDFQSWQSNQSLSYAEIIDWAEYMLELASRFNLMEEFHENGLI